VPFSSICWGMAWLLIVVWCCACCYETPDDGHEGPIHVAILCFNIIAGNIDSLSLPVIY
jgi:hypothetical protein